MIDFLQRRYGLPLFIGLSLWPLLWLLSRLYAGVVFIRNFWYDFRQPWKANCKVVSLGNLSAGGTGKTPVGLSMAQHFKQCGWRVAIVLRGYAGKNGLSDEAQLYRQALGKESVFVGAHRQSSLEKLVKDGFNLAILDDAFQHRRVFRDINIVLVDATQPPWEDNLLPLGFLRESCASLRRANALLLTRSEQVNTQKLRAANDLLSAYLDSAQQFVVSTKVQRITTLAGDNINTKPDEAFFLISAIGQPENFKRTAQTHGIEVLGNWWFPDHHHFSEKEQLEALNKAKALGAKGILITAKDAVKWTVGGEVYILHISATLPQDLLTHIEHELHKN